MTQKQKVEMVKRLRELTGAGMMDCKKALERNNWDSNKAVKYLKHLPLCPSIEYWSSRQYLFCEYCDRFYVVKKDNKICEVCGNNLHTKI